MNKISQDQAEKIIDAPLAALILESVLSGFQDYYSKINEETQAILSATARASIINDFMVYHARDKIQNHPRVRPIKRRGRYHLLIDEQVEIKLKKLGRNRIASNIPTGEVQEYNTQIPLLIPRPLAPQQLEFPNMRMTMANLIAGYQVNRKKSSVAVYIVCPQGSRNEWEWELSSVSLPEPSISSQPQPTPTPVKPKKTVVPKKTKLAHRQTDKWGTYAESPGTLQS